VSYGWWINGRLYQYSDPDMMKFRGGTANENQSRLINCAVAGTVFLNSDDLTSTEGQTLARLCLTNANINEVARTGISFRPVEGNTGTTAADVFVKQEGSTWYVAIFNYKGFGVNKSLDLARLGIAGSYTAMDLWSGTLSPVSGSTWTVNLGARQARLFRLGSGLTTAVGPTNQVATPGDSVTLTTLAGGTPPFSYLWKKDGQVLSGANGNSITLSSMSLGDIGQYAVEVIGGNGSVTNSAFLSITPASIDPPNLKAEIRGGNLNLDWPSSHRGWRLEKQTNDFGAELNTGWTYVTGSAATNCWAVPIDEVTPAAFFRLIYP